MQWVHSNKTGQCNFSGQRDRSFFIVPGQRDNGTSSKSCHGTGFWQPVSSHPGTSRGTEMKEKAFSCFRTSFPELERPFLVAIAPLPPDSIAPNMQLPKLPFRFLSEKWKKKSIFTTLGSLINGYSRLLFSRKKSYLPANFHIIKLVGRKRPKYDYVVKMPR